MKVFRIEHPFDGKGPYQTSFSDWEELSWVLCDRHSGYKNKEQRPAMATEQWNGDIWDFCTYYGEKSKFAFETVKELRAWFRGWMKKMKEYGFVIREYEIHPQNMLRGTKQIVFAQTNTHVAEYSL